MSEAKAKLTLDTANFEKGVAKALGDIGKMSENLAKIGIGVGIAGLATAAAGAAVAIAGMREAMDLGGELSDLEAQTGIAAGQALILQQAFENSGLSADKVGPAINKMQRAIVEGQQGVAQYADAFANLGLSLDTLAGMSPEEQFAAIQSAIAKINDPANRAAAAMEIFGRTGGEMLALFSDTQALETARKEIGSMADDMDENAARFDAISDRLKTIESTKRLQFFTGMASELGTEVDSIVQKLAETDFGMIGKGLAADIGGAFEDQSVAAGVATLGARIITVIGAAFSSLGDVIAASFTKAFEEPIVGLQAVIEAIMNKFSNFAAGKSPLSADEEARLKQLRAENEELMGFQKSLGRDANYEDRRLRMGLNDAEILRLEEKRGLETDSAYIYARKMDEGGARVGWFGGGKTAEELNADAYSKWTDAVTKLLPEASAAVAREWNRDGEDSPPRQPRKRGGSFFDVYGDYEGAGGGGGTSTDALSQLSKIVTSSIQAIGGGGGFYLESPAVRGEAERTRIVAHEERMRTTLLREALESGYGQIEIVPILGA